MARQRRKVDGGLRALSALAEGRDGGRGRLVGDRFGRADITAASLLAPLAPPGEHPVYRRGAMPAAVEDALTRWSARPSLRWVERTYAEHRRPS